MNRSFRCCVSIGTYLEHPVDGRWRPTVWRLAVDADGLALVDGDGARRLVGEVVEPRLADEDGVGGGRAPLVRREALVLT